MTKPSRSPQPPLSHPSIVFSFDYDGVIADSLEYFWTAFLEACRCHGYDQFKTHDDFLAMFDTNMYEGMARAGIPQAAVEPILETMSGILDNREGGYELFESMPDILEELSLHATLYVVTSNVGSIVDAHLREHGVTCFVEVLGSEFDTSKSRKISLLKERHPGARHYYVGDTAGDMHEARAAGVKSVAATWGWHSRERLAKAYPDVILDGPKALLALLDR